MESAIYGYVHALVDGVDRIYFEILDPRLYDEIICPVPHEYPRGVFYDAILGFPVEPVSLFFVHGTLGCLDEAVELRVDASRAVSSGTHTRGVKERIEEVLRIRIVSPPRQPERIGLSLVYGVF